MAEPSLCPKAHLLDDREKFSPGWCQVILDTATRAASTLYYAGELQLLEASREQRGRHARDSPVQVIKADAVAQQLANNQASVRRAPMDFQIVSPSSADARGHSPVHR
jgi:hypothetical protein